MKSRTSAKILPRLVYGGIVAGLLISAWFLFRPKPVDVETSMVTRGEFIENFLIDGKVRSKNKTTVVAFTSGDIDEIDLRAGDAVKKNQTITILRWDYTKKITSPITGVVVRVYRETAGPVNRGEPLIDIVDPEDLEIMAEPLTTDALRIPVDTSVQVMGLETDKIYSAKVTNVSRAGFAKISALGVEEERTEVRMAFLDVPKDVLSKIGDNFHVELSMQISRAENALKVPLGALFKDQQKWAVYIVEGKKAHLRHVEIVKRNDREAHVNTGLQEGDKVILFPGDTVFEGTRVKFKK